MNCIIKMEADETLTAEDCATWFAAEYAKAVANEASEVLTPDKVEKYEHTQKMLHYTIIFQVFVFMQIFNLINSRKIEKDELNVFKNFLNNPWFIVIFVLTIGIQMVLVELGGTAVKTYALNMQQNIVCLAIGATELIWGLILKFLPIGWFQCIDLKAEIAEDGEDGEAEQKAPSGAMALKRVSTQKSKPKSSKNSSSKKDKTKKS